MLPPLPRSHAEWFLWMFPFVALRFTFRDYPRQLRIYLAFVGVVTAMYYATITWDYVAHPAPLALETALSVGFAAVVVWLAWAYVQYRQRTQEATG